MELLSVFYVLLGLGLGAGLPHWKGFGRLVYAILFPPHALLFWLWSVLSPLGRRLWIWLWSVP